MTNLPKPLPPPSWAHPEPKLNPHKRDYGQELLGFAVFCFALLFILSAACLFDSQVLFALCFVLGGAAVVWSVVKRGKVKK